MFNKIESQYNYFSRKASWELTIFVSIYIYINLETTRIYNFYFKKFLVEQIIINSVHLKFQVLSLILELKGEVILFSREKQNPFLNDLNK